MTSVWGRWGAFWSPKATQHKSPRRESDKTPPKSHAWQIAGGTCFFPQEQVDQLLLWRCSCVLLRYLLVLHHYCTIYYCFSNIRQNPQKLGDSPKNLIMLGWYLPISLNHSKCGLFSNLCKNMQKSCTQKKRPRLIPKCHQATHATNGNGTGTAITTSALLGILSSKKTTEAKTLNQTINPNYQWTSGCFGGVTTLGNHSLILWSCIKTE